LYVSQNRQRPLFYSSLTDWFLQPWYKEFTARYGLIPYIKQITFSLLKVNDTNISASYDGNPSHCGLMNCSTAQSTALPTFHGKKLLRSLDLVLCGSHEPIYTVSLLTIPHKYSYLQVKVEFTLEHATKFQKGSRDIAVLFL